MGSPPLSLSTSVASTLLIAATALVGCDDRPKPAGPFPSAGPSPATPPTVFPTPPAPAPQFPRDLNVVLITVDALRADMPWLGYPRPIAPNLTRLADQSVVYTHAYALSSYTSMSLGGLMSARYPSELPRSGLATSAFGDEAPQVPPLVAIVIGADTDNTGSHSIGHVDALRLITTP